IGLILAEDVPAEVGALLLEVQHDLFDLGGEVSIPGHALLTDTALARLDSAIEAWNAELPRLREFVLPGGTRAAAAPHLARAVGECSRRTRVKSSGFLFIVGMLAPGGDFDAQGSGVFAQIGEALKSAGAGWANVVQFTTYLVHSQDIARFMAWRQREFATLFP